MAYFSNGTEGEQFEAKYCSKCRHGGPDGCPIMVAHMLDNYEEANNPDSYLHKLIPRRPDGFADECRFFSPFRENETPAWELAERLRRVIAVAEKELAEAEKSVVLCMYPQDAIAMEVLSEILDTAKGETS